jgi:hypothetical protein
MKNNRSTEEHPSYGIVQISRTQGGDDKLFGSSIRHQYKIHMTICKAELIRDDLHHDRHFPRDHLIEIEMSTTQFAELITSMSLGSGVPCTIRRFCDGDLIGTEACPTTPKREQFEGEFREEVEKMTKDLSSLISESREILNGKILKADRERLKGLIFNIESAIKDHMPFMVGMWNEQMDKTVTEAKGEVESFVQTALREAGLGELQKRLEESGQKLIELQPLEDDDGQG